MARSGVPLHFLFCLQMCAGLFLNTSALIACYKRNVLAVHTAS